MGLKLDAVEQCTVYAIDPNLDIEKYETGLRREETIHHQNGRLNYDGPIAFEDVIDAKMLHEVAAGVK
jgi:hypothetical protein